MTSGPESISTIETELMTLVRHLENLGRTGSLYVDVDRAGYLALRTLDRLGAVRTNALADALQLDASTVTRQVTALVAGRLVERRPDPDDGRSSTLGITAQGRRTMRRVEAERRRVLDEMFRSWDEAERHDLGRGLTQLNAALIEQLALLRQAGSRGKP
jgi:DNA-binding MarR family transcriptional regulator